jgi:hypothetical protein
MSMTFDREYAQRLHPQIQNQGFQTRDRPLAGG